MAHTLDLVVYATNSMTEIHALLLAKVTYPDLRTVWDRYFVVHLSAVLETFPKLARKVVREADRLAGTGNTHVDAGALRRAHAEYGRAVRPMNNKPFSDELRRTRNSVAAHHITAESGNIDGLVQWVNDHASSSAVSTKWADNPVIMNSLRWSDAAVRFGHSAFQLLNADALPEISASEYRQKVAALDNATPTKGSSRAEEA
ncbi:hypothetical protein C5C95_14970 [Rathayibacter sp. AY1B7]|nr:hypothetical protein C5C64_15295 [Rathayibacter sp. AY1D3]PPH95994.1 hypothetical protein C5C95_14970 [Rathayibacter sp. AY1B7]